MMDLSRFFTLSSLLVLAMCSISVAEADVYQGRVSREVYIQEANDAYDGGVGAQAEQSNSYQGQVERQAPQDKGIIGASFVIKPNVEPVVQAVFPGTPAYHAGIRPGDRIVMINNEPVKGWSMDEVDYAIPDVPGEAVTFLIDRYGQMTMKAVVVQSKNALSLR